jgi:hypothetical protein
VVSAFGRLFTRAEQGSLKKGERMLGARPLTRGIVWSLLFLSVDRLKVLKGSVVMLISQFTDRLS